ncbi:MAG: two-component system regulatory protein YycI [Sporolactobacillus sp.]|jgi:regulatory protein YycI of two-component signal transduction system YycFG|nr:two-component system regulatory protein YycI [Sporolactobacillus sp.]
MNWSKTKSIFIICFLLLDAFLIFELYVRQQDEGIERVSDNGPKNSFRLPASVPSTPSDVTFLRGSRMNFSKKKNEINRQLVTNKQNKSQKLLIGSDGTQLVGTFTKPMVGKPSSADFQSNLLSMVYQGGSYTYWKTDEKNGKIEFAQLFNNQPVFIGGQSSPRMLSFSLNGNGTGEYRDEVISYRQSYFHFRKSNEVDIISANKAISTLGESTNLLDSESPRILKVELGYINLVGDADTDPLIFIPAWHIVVKTKATTKEYFVNAMSGNVQTMN